MQQKAVVERQSAEIELLKQQVQGLVEKIQEVETKHEQKVEEIRREAKEEEEKNIKALKDDIEKIK